MGESIGMASCTCTCNSVLHVTLFVGVVFRILKSVLHASRVLRNSSSHTHLNHPTRSVKRRGGKGRLVRGNRVWRRNRKLLLPRPPPPASNRFNKFKLRPSSHPPPHPASRYGMSCDCHVIYACSKLTLTVCVSI